MKRSVIITGASSGIGAATALALATTSRLLLVARRGQRLSGVAARVVAAGGEAACCAIDLTADGASTVVVDAALVRFGAIDAVVHNAGAFATAPVAGIDAAHAERLWRLNVLAPMALTAAAVPSLRRSTSAWIITVSSIAADGAFPGTGAYAGSKAALEAWSRVAREELRADRIRVGVVVPGATDTDVWGETHAGERGRMCRADDIASAIRFMLDAPSSASIDRLVVTPPGGPL
jgi:NADP-dependent 3-hydroxy acid dehydrogenase YdfG